MEPDNKEPEDYDEARARYMKAAHAMQSGVAYLMQYDPSQSELKHIRVGINSSMSNVGSLVSLLILKGIITKEEYATMAADDMEREAESYRVALEDILGVSVELG